MFAKLFGQGPLDVAASLTGYLAGGLVVLLHQIAPDVTGDTTVTQLVTLALGAAIATLGRLANAGATK
jgi:hypothetical protein